ncbi:helix-turn-helix transcriptional regulator [Streptomyces sp. WMMC500]|uniref:helix-turn-helix domain-containing protein n=1 Tax=Streptomyces sp. WMMC500 TaxID=3015154 RepID=UPI00248C2FA3|nr:helix-turn-helix transcriptional regulator [Streptomyces sp. WMMC500]WBB59112.1 helix-turn-helix transcriptional regulator [Streptomyces sp. WMMC500]
METCKTPRQKYGEELRLRRLAKGMTQEALAEVVVCSPTLISHFEAGRRLPRMEDAQRIDQALGTDGFFARWLVNLEGPYADHFAEAAELERLAVVIREFAVSAVPGLLQTADYARAIFRAVQPNHTWEELDRRVLNRLERARILDDPKSPALWTVLDEGVIRRAVGGPEVMAAQVEHIASLADAGRIRLHVVPFSAGAHSLMEGMMSLMSFDAMAPVSYVEGVTTGQLLDDPGRVATCHTYYGLALGDALSHRASISLLEAAAEEFRNA